MPNEATVAKLHRHPGALDAAAARDAIRFLQASPEMPAPDIRIADYGEILGVKLAWCSDLERLQCEVTFNGEGAFDWRFRLGTIEKDGEGVPVERCAIEQMPDVLRKILT